MSITLKATLHGHGVTLTLRGVDVASVKVQVEQAAEWLRVQAPAQPPTQNTEQPKGWCAKTACNMTQNHKNGRAWWLSSLGRWHLVQGQVAPPRGRAQALPRFQRRDDMTIRKDTVGATGWSSTPPLARWCVCVCTMCVRKWYAACRTAKACPSFLPYGSEGLFLCPYRLIYLPASRPTRAVIHNHTDNTWTDGLSVRYEHIWSLARN